MGQRSSVLKFNNRSQEWDVPTFHWELPTSTGWEKETPEVTEHVTDDWHTASPSSLKLRHKVLF